MKIYDLKERTKQFALRIIKLVNVLPNTTAGRNIRNFINSTFGIRHSYLIIITLLLALSLVTGCVNQSKTDKQIELDKVSHSAEQASDVQASSEPVGLDKDSYQTYTNSEYGFSFDYPKELAVSEFTEGEYGHTVLVQELSSASDKLPRFFQIFISEFDEAGPITPERIREDLPDMVIEEPRQVVITQNKITALIFFSQESGLGRTREVWFVHNNYLYQVSTYAELDEFIGQVMETWRFQ